ncbi:SDR family NAD(P)-dependent oxidoreductase [Sorangium cellulosum]|uniref:SDR family NAD(P)-dependent oxidoreductase n=1 Tax=Sorangium cellulosum TaxID=56 RepID=UPI0018F87B41|nr:SDR family NAD(P)-dependent oxidoreductase [Sorangium cellulosum]
MWTRSIQAAVDAGISKFGRIDALTNNAGYGAYGPLEVTSLDKIRRQFDVNVLGVLATTKALLPHFRANRSGVIVNISSGGGRVTLPLGTHLRRHGHLEIEHDVEEEDEPEAALCASAVSGREPPAGPQWLCGLSSYCPSALAYDTGGVRRASAHRDVGVLGEVERVEAARLYGARQLYDADTAIDDEVGNAAARRLSYHVAVAHSAGRGRGAPAALAEALRFNPSGRSKPQAS